MTDSKKYFFNKKFSRYHCSNRIMASADSVFKNYYCTCEICLWILAFEFFFGKKNFFSIFFCGQINGTNINRKIGLKRVILLKNYLFRISKTESLERRFSWVQNVYGKIGIQKYQEKNYSKSNCFVIGPNRPQWGNRLVRVSGSGRAILYFVLKLRSSIV